MKDNTSVPEWEQYSKIIHDTTHEYLRVDLQVTEWQALLIAGKIQVCAENQINIARNAALEGAAEALSKETPTAWFPEGALHLKKRFLEGSISTIRSLKK